MRKPLAYLSIPLDISLDLLHQKSELVGNRSSSLDNPRILCSFPCQKSPSTNTASLYFTIDISGLPKIFVESTRYRIPMPYNALRKISSGAVSLLLIFPIIWDVMAASLAMGGYIPEWNLIWSPISLASCTGTAFPICSLHESVLQETRSHLEMSECVHFHVQSCSVVFHHENESWLHHHIRHGRQP